MREIRYRAFVLGKMYEVRSLEFTKYGICVCTDGGFHTIEGGNIDSVAHLMQYTGLNDKNGVEIYEGDIVRSNRFNINGYYIGNTYTVEFGQWFYDGGIEDCYGGYGWHVIPIKKEKHYFIDEIYSLNNIPCDTNNRDIYDIEVIGNIHEEGK